MKKDFPLNFLNLAGRIISYTSDNATTQQVQALKTHRDRYVYFKTYFSNFFT